MVSNGDTIFTLIGFIGLYFALGLLFLYLTGRELGRGPDEEAAPSHEPEGVEVVASVRKERLV
jgi:cytochrome d ubiquinol oxidase subunit I